MLVLEAMAPGLPVIASRVGPIPESIVKGENGWPLDPGDRKMLERHLVNLLRNPEERKRMGLNGHERIKSHVSSSRMASEYVSVYREAKRKR